MIDLMTASPRQIRRRLARAPSSHFPGRAARRVALSDVRNVARKRTNATRENAVAQFVKAYDLAPEVGHTTAAAA